MPELTVNICGQATSISCAPEDEARLTHLLALVEQRADGARAIVGDNDRWRQLLFAAIFLADELDSGETSAVVTPTGPDGDSDDAAARRLSAVAARIGAALDRIEGAANGA